MKIIANAIVMNYDELIQVIAKTSVDVINRDEKIKVSGENDIIK